MGDTGRLDCVIGLTGPDMDRYYVCEDGLWMHRSPLKLALNPVLRKLQFWTRKPWVIASRTEFGTGRPHFTGYTLARVEYLGR